MSHNIQSTPCDLDRIESFLAGHLSSLQERELIEHLNACATCRDTLERRAAEPGVWSEAETMLRPSPFDEHSHRAMDQDESDKPDGWHPLQIQGVLDGLRPTDDPQMLGRVGGYEVSGVVGAGGMGVVLKAVDKSLDRTVAIKVLAPHLAANGAARKRFAREAKAAAAVLHPNVIAIHCVSNDDSTPYLVMPYVRGASLQKRLDIQGPLSLAEILRIGSQVAAGLAAAHAQGLVHRDIKPANILLEEGVERVTITDFGLARAVDDATMTHSGVIAGTPQYMSPEQARGEAVDQRSDLFSLGSVLYAMCTGHSPFRAESVYGVMRRIIDDEPTSVRQINPDIPDWLEAIICRLMSKRASDRFESAAQVAELLENCLGHVQHPTAVPLPDALVRPKAGLRSPFNIRRKGVMTMFAGLGIGLLGLVLAQVSAAPEIAGEWSGDDWARVELKQTGPGKYDGSFTKAEGDTGTLHVKWSRVERRFNGTWQEGDSERGGRISIRLVDDEIRGGWTTSKQAVAETGTPRLADLLWNRGARTAEAVKSASESSEQKPWLIDAVARFNTMGSRHPIGKDQPLLTDDEVVCAIQSLPANSEPDGLSKRDVEELRTILKTRRLPQGWQFESVSDLAGVDGDRFEGWFIQLVRSDEAGRKAAYRVRQRLLRQLQRGIKPSALDPKRDDDATPLAAAAKSFNEQHNRAGGVDQQPLTEEEVVAAIRWWKRQRNEAPVTNREFVLFQQIAETRQLPKDVKLEVISQFQSDRDTRITWSVRLVMPRVSMPGWTYAYVIREHHIRLDHGDDEQPGAAVSWGNTAPNGLQVGVRIEPRRNIFAVGEEFTPVFYYRNMGRQTLKISFPRLMTHSYFNKMTVVDAAGKKVPAVPSAEPGGPVGWLMSELAPGTEHEIRGLPIALRSDPGDADMEIRVHEETSIRVRFDLPNLVNKEGSPLQTGELILSIVHAADIRSQDIQHEDVPIGIAPRRDGETRLPGTVESKIHRISDDTARALAPKAVIRHSTDYPVKVLACSPDATLVAIAYDEPVSGLKDDWGQVVSILDVESNAPKARLNLITKAEAVDLASLKSSPQVTVVAMAFSPDGKLLAVGTSLGTLPRYNSSARADAVAGMKDNLVSLGKAFEDFCFDAVGVSYANCL